MSKWHQKKSSKWHYVIHLKGKHFGHFDILNAFLASLCRWYKLICLICGPRHVLISPCIPVLTYHTPRKHGFLNMIHSSEWPKMTGACHLHPTPMWKIMDLFHTSVWLASSSKWDKRRHFYYTLPHGYISFWTASFRTTLLASTTVKSA